MIKSKLDTKFGFRLYNLGKFKTDKSNKTLTLNNKSERQNICIHYQKYFINKILISLRLSQKKVSREHEQFKQSNIEKKKRILLKISSMCPWGAIMGLRFVNWSVYIYFMT